jgi:hypothetical protein
MHIAELLVPGPSHLEVDITIAKLKKYKSPGSDQIPAELYQAGGETLLSVIHKLITSIWNKEELKNGVFWVVTPCGSCTCLNSGRSLLLYKFTKRVMKLIVIIIVGYHCYQLHTQFYQISFFHS